MLTECMIKEMIPLIGPRAIFSKNLEVYKSSMHPICDPNANNQSVSYKNTCKYMWLHKLHFILIMVCLQIGDDFSIGDLLTFPLDDNPLSSKEFTSISTHASCFKLITGHY